MLVLKEPSHSIAHTSRKSMIIELYSVKGFTGSALKQKLEEWDAAVRARAAGDTGKARRLWIPYP